MCKELGWLEELRAREESYRPPKHAKDLYGPPPTQSEDASWDAKVRRVDNGQEHSDRHPSVSALLTF